LFPEDSKIRVYFDEILSMHFPTSFLFIFMNKRRFFSSQLWSSKAWCLHWLRSGRALSLGSIASWWIARAGACQSKQSHLEPESREDEGARLAPFMTVLP
jgi:hypothetical protein